ncbi:MAG TPA: S8 family serine peptidase, partial [Candidatus Acidoferrales bacterium]|nr:S8 family serine peptidase [Candidatus Acidoferrales bacterium]
MAQNRPRRKTRGLATLRLMTPFVMILSVLTATAGYVLAFGARNAATEAYRDGVVLMAFRSGISPARQSAILASIGASERKRIGVGVHVVSVGPGLVSGAIQSLKARREVLYAEPDYAHTVSGGALPQDTYVGNQWAVQNTGQIVNGVSGTPGADERALAAWSVTTGSNSVVVAVLDTGVQYSHPDLLTNMWTNPGGIGGCPAGTYGYNVLSSNCDPMDDEFRYGGHGTHVAGIIGAVGNNAAGVTGVNWTTSIMAVKWVYAGDSGYTSDLITAMDWVVKAKHAGVNVRVVNDSVTHADTPFSQALSDEIDLLGSNDILFVTAAGNTFQNNDTIPRYPCSYNRPNMICVAASDQNDHLWSSSSNYGITTVQLAAPGVNIYSTLRASDYGYIDGTSMSSAQVSGAAALILSLGYQSVSNLKAMILSNVDPLPALSSYVATGGRLNVCKAVAGCTSAVTATPAIAGLPVVTGVPQYGSVLGASTGIWSGLPTKYSYQWYRCAGSGSSCSPIPGAISPNYALLASADVAATLGVAVTASNSSGSSSAQSSASGLVASASSPFGITSTIQDGSSINGSLSWQVTPALSVNFVQFYVDGVLSQTASASPFLYNVGGSGLLDTTTLSNGTHVLGIRALAADNRTYGFYGATVTVINPPANTALPAISGTAGQGYTLSTSSGSWTNNPTGYTYAWDRCDVGGLNCSAIPGATSSSYTLTSADAGSTIRSAVTATNAGGSSTATSAQTAVVQPAAATPTFNPPGGAYYTPQSVTISDTTPGALIYYTTNGTAPTTASTLYSGPITVSATTTINAIAVASGFSNSAVTTAPYSVEPSINYASGISSTGLTLNGPAKITSSRLRITDGGTMEASSAFFNTPVNVQAFTNDFSFLLTSATADGFTFTLQGNAPTALGGTGGGLGFGPDPGQPNGPKIGKSVAIKFDLFSNAGEGTNSTGLFTNGATPTTPAINLTPSGVNLHSGHTFNMHMTYNGTTLAM